MRILAALGSFLPLCSVAPLAGSPRPRVVVTAHPSVIRMVRHHVPAVDPAFFAAYDSLTPPPPAGLESLVFEEKKYSYESR